MLLLRCQRNRPTKTKTKQNIKKKLTNKNDYVIIKLSRRNTSLHGKMYFTLVASQGHKTDREAKTKDNISYY